MLRVGFPVHIEGKLHEGAKALFALAQLVLCKFADGDVAHQRQESECTLLKLSNTNLNRESSSIFAPMTGLECDRFPGEPMFRKARNRRLVKIRVEKTPMLPDQFLLAVTKVLAALAIDVEDDRIDVEQKEAVRCVVHEGAEARLACTQLLLCLSQIRDVLHDAKLMYWLARLAPGAAAQVLLEMQKSCIRATILVSACADSILGEGRASVVSGFQVLNPA
jgi:hypothetical protein